MTRATRQDTGHIQSVAQRRGILSVSNLDLVHQYREAVAEMARAGVPDTASLPSLAELTATIIHVADGEQIPTVTFETFFAWWDALTAYDQLDEGVKAIDHMPALRVAYEAIKASAQL